MAELVGSRRAVYKATYAPIAIDLAGTGTTTPSRAVDKAVAVRAMALLPAEITALHSGGTPLDGSLLDVVAADTAAPVRASGFELARQLGKVPAQQIAALGRAVAELRGNALAELHAWAATGQRPADLSPLAASYAQALGGTAHDEATDAVARLVHLNSTVRSVTAGLAQQTSVSPVGRLHLERIDMIPAGTQTGELISSIPLAPKETVSIAHKEWSTISQDFQSVVTDSLENFSETGVTEKSELAQSTESQSKVSNTLDLSAQVQGGIGFVSGSASSKLDLAHDDEQTRKDSRNHSIATTRKASARVKQEHKVTIQTVSVAGQQETSTTSLTNPSGTDAMRVDYLSLMRKWRVQLYRYGLRMTYDIVIPEPGAAFRETYAQIAWLEAQLATAFTFALKPDDITIGQGGNWQQLEAQYGVSLQPPPEQVVPVSVPAQTLTAPLDDSWHWGQFQFDVPDGYQITSAWLDADLGKFDQSDRWFKIFGGPENLITQTPQAIIAQEATWLHGARGHQDMLFVTRHMDVVLFKLTVNAGPTDETMLIWRQSAWATLRQAALDAYTALQQQWSQQRAALLGGLADTDTLTLRQEENTEIMKTILGWLFGPTFSLVPTDVAGLFPPPVGVGFAELPSPVGIGVSGWDRILNYGEMIKFFHEAIEWENVLYFLYPYFWDTPANWAAARGLQHPDPDRQAFIRAGSARVVLTIRPGFETAFAQLMETGAFSDQLPPDHPYLTIAQEIEAYAATNYPGIPPASPGEQQPPDDSGERGVLIAEWYEYTPTSGVDISITMHTPDISPPDEG